MLLDLEKQKVFDWVIELQSSVSAHVQKTEERGMWKGGRGTADGAESEQEE
jgi:hypothetical protein